MDKEELAKYVGSKIRKFRTTRGMTQEELAELMNTTKQTIGRYENGTRRANQDNIFDLAEIFNRSINDFFPNTNSMDDILTIYNQLNDTRQQKVYNFAQYQLEEQNKMVNIEDYVIESLRGYVSAGTGEYLLEEIKEEVQLPRSVIPEQHYDMVLRVNGNSMEPMFQDGEYIFVRKDEHFRSGQIGVFIIDGESYLKKAYIEDSYIRLVSLNKNYKDLIFKDGSRIELIGTVVM